MFIYHSNTHHDPSKGLVNYPLNVNASKTGETVRIKTKNFIRWTSAALNQMEKHILSENWPPLKKKKGQSHGMLFK